MTPDPKRQNVPDDPSDVPMFGLPGIPGDLDPLERRTTAHPTPATDDEVVNDESADLAVIVEDPRDVAKRLVEEARRKAAPPPPDPREVAKRLGEEARLKSVARPNLAGLVPKRAPEPKRLSDRIVHSLRPVTDDPLAAIEAARHAEEQPKRPVAAPAAPRAPAPTANAADVAAKVLPGAVLHRELRIANPVVAKALWTAHRVRAAATCDLALVGAACAILDAIDRLPVGALVVLDATVADQRVGLWIDTHRGALLAISGQPEFTLAGL